VAVAVGLAVHGVMAGRGKGGKTRDGGGGGGGAAS